MKNHKILSALFFILSLSSCYTQRKAEKQGARFLNTYPEQAHKLFRDSFPCITTASDTVTVYQTATPDTITKKEITVKNDTVLISETVTVVKPVNVTRTVTVKIKDSSEIKTLQIKHAQQIEAAQAYAAKVMQMVSDRNDTIISMRQELATIKAAMGKQRKRIWLLIFALVLSVGWNFRRTIGKLIF